MLCYVLYLYSPLQQPTGEQSALQKNQTALKRRHTAQNKSMTKKQNINK